MTSIYHILMNNQANFNEKANVKILMTMNKCLTFNASEYRDPPSPDQDLLCKSICLIKPQQANAKDRCSSSI